MQSVLGRITKVDLREIFKDEARNLTPWLAQPENLAILSEEIGVELKLIQMEASVGRFSVDILAEDPLFQERCRLGLKFQGARSES